MTDADHIDMQAVADRVRELGDETAYVEQTGGGCATIYAGGYLGEIEGDQVWATMAGPGWFEGPSWSQPVASLHEFYIGADMAYSWSVPESELLYAATMADTVETLAQRIIAATAKAREVYAAGGIS